MKKYLLLFIIAVASLTTKAQIPNQKIIVTFANKLIITKEQKESFGGLIRTSGAAICRPTAGGYEITSKGIKYPVTLVGLSIAKWPNIKGLITINAKDPKEMKEFMLTEDPVITKIELPTHTVLKDVTLENLSNLTEIDFSECEGIENLVARKLPIDELNIGKSTLLKTLDCSNCRLETLVIPENSAVNKINCSGNCLSEEEVDKLIAALPATGGELCIYDETAESNNECTAKQVADAKAKNWKVVDATGKEYAGSGAVVSLNSIKTDSNDNAPYYDLQGRRMKKPTRSGLYIHNGKKVYIK